MSQGVPCENPKKHRAHWVVWQRNANHSAFNGYRYTPSAYSQVNCPLCRGVWRTRAAYVRNLPDASGATQP